MLNQTGLKNLKPKIKLNHNIYTVGILVGRATAVHYEIFIPYIDLFSLYILLPHFRPRDGTLDRGTQRIVSVEYLFGRPVIASNFRLGKCHLELS